MVVMTNNAEQTIRGKGFFAILFISNKSAAEKSFTDHYILMIGFSNLDNARLTRHLVATREAGGTYLFDNEEDAQRYLKKHTERLQAFGYTDIRGKIFAVNEALSALSVPSK